MQKINNINVESRFIKNLLKNSYLPIYPTIPSTGFVHKDTIYTIGNSFFKCLNTGYMDQEYIIKCSESLLCGQKYIDGVITAGQEMTEQKGIEFERIDDYIPYQFSPNKTKNFISKSAGYDIETHIQLGNYLLYYRMMTGIDLLPLYNYNCGKTTTQISFKQEIKEVIGENDIACEISVIDNIPSSKTIFAVPLKLDSKYTIFSNIVDNVIIYKAFLTDLGRVKFSVQNEILALDSTITDNKPQVVHIDYKNPYVVSTRLSTNYNINYHDFENCFYLLIEMKNPSAALYVLEGDYTNKSKSMVFDYNYIANNDTIARLSDVVTYPKNPYLKYFPSDYSIPYSPNLIEYLLKYTITPDDEIKNNILRVQEKLDLLTNDSVKKDIWDKYIDMKIISNLAFPKSIVDKVSYPIIYDYTGAIDKNIENKLFKYKGV